MPGIHWLAAATLFLPGAQPPQDVLQGDLFGAAVAGPGDLDGDGHDDLLIGAPLTHGNRGAVWACSGRDGSALYEIVGLRPKAYFGTSIAVLGDVDGDGTPDFAASGAARLTVWSGRTGERLLPLEGEGSSATRGRTCVDPGDLDGDGLSDLLLVEGKRVRALSGATGTQLFEYSLPDSGAGSVEVWLPMPTPWSETLRAAAGGDWDGNGQPDLAVVRRYRLDILELRCGHALFSLQSQVALDAAWVGDVDGDGLDELAVGFGPLRDAQGQVLEEPTSLLLGAAGTVHRLPAPEGHSMDYGMRVSGTADVNADRVPDFAIAAPGTFPLWGAVRLHSGIDGAVLHTWQPGGNRFGEALAPAGDVDGDSFPDLIVGSRNYHAPALPGAVHVVSGASGEELFKLHLADLATAPAPSSEERRAK